VTATDTLTRVELISNELSNSGAFIDDVELYQLGSCD
jgi:hypothetical protein